MTVLAERAGIDAIHRAGATFHDELAAVAHAEAEQGARGRAGIDDYAVASAGVAEEHGSCRVDGGVTDAPVWGSAVFIAAGLEDDLRQHAALRVHPSDDRCEGAHVVEARDRFATEHPGSQVDEKAFPSACWIACDLDDGHAIVSLNARCIPNEVAAALVVAGGMPLHVNHVVAIAAQHGAQLGQGVDLAGSAPHKAGTIVRVKRIGQISDEICQGLTRVWDILIPNQVA
ncbi:hypothetical protein D3C81_1378980 [compost metagenome]